MKLSETVIEILHGVTCEKKYSAGSIICGMSFGLNYGIMEYDRVTSYALKLELIPYLTRIPQLASIFCRGIQLESYSSFPSVLLLWHSLCRAISGSGPPAGWCLTPIVFLIRFYFSNRNPPAPAGLWPAVLPGGPFRCAVPCRCNLILSTCGLRPIACLYCA